MLVLFFLFAAASYAQQETIAALKKNADAGDANSKARLGLVYYCGEMGITVDYSTALKYFTPAAERATG